MGSENQAERVIREKIISGEWAPDQKRPWLGEERLRALDAEVARLTEENARLAASRRVPELDNHHNALACGYCAGPLKEHAEQSEARLARAREALMAVVHHVHHRTVDSTPLTLEELGLDEEKECPAACDAPDGEATMWNLVRAALADTGGPHG
jgi:hypothetical protein